LFLRRVRGIGGASVKWTSGGFSRILEEAARPSASVSEVARRYGIDRRILCRWKQELSLPVFVAVEITDAALDVERPAS
jgi:hypothetical protein